MNRIFEVRMPHKKGAAKVVDDYTKKCHYTMNMYTCTHRKWLLKPRITHHGQCNQPTASRNPCRNMASSPRELKTGRLCKECREKEDSAAWVIEEAATPAKHTTVSIIPTAKQVSTAGPPTLPQSAKAVKKASAATTTTVQPAQIMAKREPVSISSTIQTSKATVKHSSAKILALVQPEIDAKKISSEQSVVATAESKPQNSKQTTLNTEVFESTPMGAVEQPKTSLVQLGWVKVEETPDWEIISFPTDKDLHAQMTIVDADNKDAKELGRIDNWAQVEKPKVPAPVEDDQWDLVGKEEGDYQQGVDGWEMKKGGKSSCRTQ